MPKHLPEGRGERAEKEADMLFGALGQTSGDRAVSVPKRFFEFGAIVVNSGDAQPSFGDHCHNKT